MDEPATMSPVQDSTARLKRRRAARARALRRRRAVTLAALAVALGLGVLLVRAVSHHASHRVRARAHAAPVRAPGAPELARGSSPAAQLAAVARLAAYGLPLFCGGRAKRVVALTFDDGPGPYTRL